MFDDTAAVAPESHPALQTPHDFNAKVEIGCLFQYGSPIIGDISKEHDRWPVVD
jgi:hypothetical protein